jgi:hypothetical protein
MYDQLAPIFYRCFLFRSRTPGSIASTYGIEMGRIDVFIPGHTKAYCPAG